MNGASAVLDMRIWWAVNMALGDMFAHAEASGEQFDPDFATFIDARNAIGSWLISRGVLYKLSVVLPNELIESANAINSIARNRLSYDHPLVTMDVLVPEIA